MKATIGHCKAFINDRMSYSIESYKRSRNEKTNILTSLQNHYKKKTYDRLQPMTITELLTHVLGQVCVLNLLPTWAMV